MKTREKQKETYKKGREVKVWYSQEIQLQLSDYSLYMNLERKNK